MSKYIILQHLNNNLNIEKYLKLIENYNDEVGVWIDAKNIDKVDNCIMLYNKISEFKKKNDHIKILLEFPSETNIENIKINDCINNFKKLNIYTSYYVPTKIGNNCIKNSDACNIFYKKIKKILNSNAFTDLSFDISLLDLIVNMNIKNKIKLNIWGIEENLKIDKKIKKHKFRFAIINNINDPNSI